MKKFLFFVILYTFIGYSFAQIPENYYNAAFGTKKEALKTAMKTIINPHTVRSYANLWTDFQTTDKRADGKVWDMYSNCTFTFVSDQCGNYSNICDCYNREHSFPKSWFNDASPMYTDLFHLYPTDGKVNGYRSNYPFGETNGTTHGTGKVGSCTFPGYTGTVFEPADEYKGDFARSYFYMVTCYQDRVPSWTSTEATQMLNKTTYPSFQTWAINLLLKWSREDPISEKEINRNNAVYGIQDNRNPFIDFPHLEEYIWGDSMNIIFDPGGTTIPVTGVTVSPDVLNVGVGTNTTLTAIIAPANATNPSVTWTSSNTNIATVTSSGSVTIHDVGNINIIVTTHDGGFKDTCFVSVTGTGIKENSAQEAGLRIYPNPFNNRIVVDNSDRPLNVVEIYAINGQKLVSEDFGQQASGSISLESLSAGIYIIKVHNIVMKIVKELQ